MSIAIMGAPAGGMHNKLLQLFRRLSITVSLFMSKHRLIVNLKQN
jgi:hypothetical protein